MSENSKHSLCAILSGVFALVGLIVVLDLSTGIFRGMMPYDLVLDAVEVTLKTIASTVWYLRYIIIAALAFAVIFLSDTFPAQDVYRTRDGKTFTADEPGVPKGENAEIALVCQSLMILAVIITTGERIFSGATEDYDGPASIGEILSLVGVPIFTAAASLITAALIKQFIGCARKAGWID